MKAAGEKSRALDRLRSARLRCEEAGASLLPLIEGEHASAWRAASDELLAASEALERACRIG